MASIGILLATALSITPELRREGIHEINYISFIEKQGYIPKFVKALMIH